MNIAPITSFVVLSSLGLSVGHAATKYIDLAGPASGYLAISNFKNSLDQAGIEGSSNGLPDYPNYQIPVGQTNAGRYTAIVASPMSPSSDYSALFNNASGVTVNNLITSDSNYSTMSAGLIGFDDSLLTGTGLETIPVSALSFNFDTLQWNGVTANGWNTGMGNISISPFSSVHTVYNDGGGAGNASAIYNLLLSNVTGSGLTFQDGQLVSMDIDGDLSVLLRIGNFPFAGSVTFTGTFSTEDLTYKFDLNDTESIAIFTDIRMVMNREGTASVIPEPGSAALALLSGVILLRRRRQA